MQKISSKKAEKKLRAYVASKFKATCSKKSFEKHKPYARLLFQAVCSFQNGGQIKTNGKRGIALTRQNIYEHKPKQPYPYRKRILPDLFFRSNKTRRVCILGEAKGTNDITGRYPGSTYSCAHRIVRNLIQEKGLETNQYQGFLHSFLAQPIGYLDAVIHLRNDLGFNRLYFALLICEDKESRQFYANFGRELVKGINTLFPKYKNALRIEKTITKNNIEHYYIFCVHKKRIQAVCKAMCLKAKAQFF